MVKIVKKKVPFDPAFGKRVRYEVGSWSFPTRKMAEDFLRTLKKRRSK